MVKLKFKNLYRQKDNVVLVGQSSPDIKPELKSDLKLKIAIKF